MKVKDSKGKKEYIPTQNQCQLCRNIANMLDQRDKKMGRKAPEDPKGAVVINPKPNCPATTPPLTEEKK